MPTTANQQTEHSMEKTPEMQQCLQECLNCYSLCLQTVPYCLRLGGQHAEAGHIRLLLDCAEICQVSAGFMLRGSDLHGSVCAVCAEVCERCAQDCERLGLREDAQMQACARACRQCGAACREMSAMTASAR